MVEGSSFAPLMAPLGRKLQEAKLTVAVAESCTGGLLAAMLTDLPEASSVFLGGFITYTYEAKERLLGIPRSLLEEQGAVSEEVARLMAAAAREKVGADLGLSITCIAGPGEQEGKPGGIRLRGGEHRRGGRRPRAPPRRGPRVQPRRGGRGGGRAGTGSARPV